jgi:hypothetical protein
VKSQPSEEDVCETIRAAIDADPAVRDHLFQLVVRSWGHLDSARMARIVVIAAGSEAFREWIHERAQRQS